MPIYRKGDDQFELQHRALNEPQGFNHPDTVRDVINDPDTRIEHINRASRVVREQDGYSIKDTDPITGGDTEWHQSNSWSNKDYPVSGSDIAKVKRGK
jgi:hypothetical protein